MRSSRALFTGVFLFVALLAEVASAQTVATPAFSVPSGTTSTVQISVTVTDATSGATIYYTLDGTTPSTSSPTVASGGAVLISTSRTLKAYAVKSGMTDSTVASATYTVTGAAASGEGHVIVLKTDGSVWGWGLNTSKQLGDGTTTNRTTAIPAGGSVSGVISIATGAYHTVVLKSDGTVWSWGLNNDGQLGDNTTTDRLSAVQVQDSTGNYLAGVVAICCGAYHNFALKSDGTVWAWGLNSNGQLGDGTTTQRNGAVQITGLGTVAKLMAGSYHSLLLRTDGTVWAWGANSSGQLGDGTTTDRYSAVSVGFVGGTVITDISGGDSHSLALKNDGTVWAWGLNTSGQVGDNTTTQRNSPVQASGLSSVVGVKAGYNHSLALKSDGTVWAWGDNTLGELADGTCLNRLVPVQSTGVSSVVRLSAGYNITELIDSSGHVLVCGANQYAQMGIGGTSIYSNAAQVAAVFGSKISSGSNHTLMVKNDGTVCGWGDNTSGDIGDGTILLRPLPVATSTLTSITAVAAKGNRSMALKSDGTLWSWGAQPIGNGTTSDASTPTQLSFSGASKLAIGAFHSMVLKTDNTVWCWGTNSNGQLGDNTTTTRTSPVQTQDNTGSPLGSISAIAAGDRHSLALKTDGSVWAWGNNSNGQLGDGTTTQRNRAVQVSGLNGIVAIAGGTSISAAVDGNGSVWTWGANDNGQLGNGTTTGSLIPVQVQISSGGYLSGIVAVRCGQSACAALRKDGTVWAWGLNGSGQLGNGTFTQSTTAVQVLNLSGIVDIQLGDNFGSALKQDGSVQTWGYNFQGDLGVTYNNALALTVPGFNTHADVIIPTVSISTPASNTTMTLAQTATFTSSASVAGWGIANVKYYVDATQIGSTVTSSPYTVSWTPPTWGNFTFTAITTDTAGNTSFHSTPLTLVMPFDSNNDGVPDWWALKYFGTLDYNTNPITQNATVGTAFSYTIPSVGSPTSYDANGLPPGLAVNTTSGLISGTPTVAGTFSAIMSYTASSVTVNKILQVVVAPAAPVITSAGTASAKAGSVFNYTITATNNPTSFSASGLPTGLTIDTTTGLIAGTPVASGVSSVSLGAINAGGTGTKTLTLTVTNPSVPVINSGLLATGNVSVPFSYTILASNGPTGFTASPLPAGLSLNSVSGVISGTPTTAGTTTVVLGASNAGGSAITKSLTLTINSSATTPVITSGLLNYATNGVPFSYQITATNSPTSYAATGVPAGLSINTTTGVISGSTTVTGTSTVSVSMSAINASGTGKASLVLTLNPPAPAITSATTASGTIGSVFRYQIVASNVVTSYSASGLPPGLSIDANTGMISGTPTTTGNASQSGTYSVILGATGPGGSATPVTLVITLSIPVPPPVISSGLTVSAVSGTPFSYQIAASPTPTSYSATGLPSGLSINTTTGLISGTRTGTTGSPFTVTLGATNTGGTGTASLTLIVSPSGSPLISSATTATATAGVPFSYTITATNSPTSYTASGLPLGMSFNTSTGVISGSTLMTGTYSIPITATNALPGTGTGSLLLTVNPPAPVITSAQAVSGTFGVALNYAIVATNNPTSYAATGLPPGMNVDASSGLISGVPTAAGTYTSTISATNDGGTNSATVTFTIASGNSQPIFTQSFAYGESHTLLLKSDGTVWSSGYNFYGQLGNGGLADIATYTPVTGLSGVVAVACGPYHSYALKSDGTVWAWGYNVAGQLGNGTADGSATPVQVSGLTGVIAIAAGAYSGMALKSDGTVWTWGDNSAGQLGNGLTTGSSTPVQVVTTAPPSPTALSGVVAIAAGYYHCLALKADGEVWAWGQNAEDELGNETGTLSRVAIPVTAVTNALSITAGATFSSALARDGTVWTWGDNSEGYLGIGTTGGNTMTSGPVHVLNSTGGMMSGVTSVKSSNTHLAALRNDGRVWVWGANYDGQSGSGTISANCPFPVQTANLTGVTAVATAGWSTAALKSDGSLWAWGFNNLDSEIGAATGQNQNFLPTTVVGLSGITAVSGDRSHFLALKSDGTVWAWGDPVYPFYNDGSPSNRAPAQVAGLSGITAISCGAAYNMALKSDGTVWMWGRNNVGQLGNGNWDDNPTPAQVTGLTGVTITAISAGRSFAMALDSTKHVWTWGYNGDGELGNGNFSNTNVPGQIPDANLNSIDAISAGAYHALALKHDQTVWAWGFNAFGEVGVASYGSYPTPAQVSGPSSITSIKAGSYHSIALDTTHHLWNMGLNADGQSGDGTTTDTFPPAQVSGLSNVSFIQMGPVAYFGLLVKTDGTLWAWGNNSNGQLGVGYAGPVSGSASPTGSKSLVPVIGLGGSTITALATARYSTIALKSDGTVLQWGNTDPAPVVFSVPVQVGGFNTTPAPVISPAAGSYTGTQAISLSTTIPSGQIRYTIDGTQPTASSALYSSSFTLDKSALVTASVFVSGAQTGPVSSTQYYINDASQTGLPTAATSLSTTAVSSGEIDLTWTVSGTVTHNTNNVYRSSDGGTTYQLVAALDAATNSFADTGVTSGTSYIYKVGTVNASGESMSAATSSVSPITPGTLNINVTTPAGATPLP